MNDEVTVPHEVVRAMFVDGLTRVAAWRKYLGLTQAQVAERIGLTQDAYAQQEVANKPSMATLNKIADAMGIAVEQLY